MSDTDITTFATEGNRDLHILCAHLDDFEISCNGYIFKHHNRYENIYVHVATNNKHKDYCTESWIYN